jgi:hypothetical protein
MINEVPPMKWVHHNGLYKPRLGIHNTGQTLQTYTKFMEIPEEELSLEARINACMIPLPIDSPEAKEAQEHQHRMLGAVTMMAMKDLSNSAICEIVMRIVEGRITANSEDFYLAVPGTADSNSYKDPSFKALYPFYNFLNYVTDIKTPCAFYDYFEGPFTLKVCILHNVLRLEL